MAETRHTFLPRPLILTQTDGKRIPPLLLPLAKASFPSLLYRINLNKRMENCVLRSQEFPILENGRKIEQKKGVKK